ncbi:MAG: CoA transferase [Acidobacteria bacterium]|nr:CoA transferase [Acidobacteriota bacterium]
MTSSSPVDQPGARQPGPEGALLEGVRVVELATIVMAPSACAMLSDFGAEVIKIEAPGRGDLYRYFQDLPGMPDSEIPYCFLLDGRNKKSVVIDLKQESGQAVAHRLIETADVFLTNCHNSVLDDLGMTWDRLREVNPRLIFAHGTGYGHTGPEAEKPGYDQVCYWTRSGLVATFTPVDGHLGPLGCGTGDHPTGVTLFSAVLAGLLKRERTGVGSYVTTSLLAAGAWANACAIQAKLVGAEFHEKRPREHTMNFGQLYYRTCDDRLIKLSIVEQDRDWERFCLALDRADLIADERFCTTPERIENMPEFVALLDADFAKRDFAEWSERFTRYEIAYSLVSNLDDIVADEQLEAIGMFRDLDHPEYGRLRTVDSPVLIEGEDKVKPQPAPELGEHTGDLLRELGLDAAEIEGLADRGVISGRI